MLEINKTYINSWLCSFLVVGILILNSTFISNVILIGLVGLLFVINIQNIKKQFYTKFFVLSLILVSLLIGYYESVYTLEDLVRFGVLFQFFWIFPYRVSFKFEQITLIAISLIYVIVLQVGLAFGTGLESFINSFYPIQNNVWQQDPITGSAAIKELNARFGGRFHNPNIMGQISCLVYALLLRPVQAHKNKKVVLVLSFLVFISVFLSGSRTAMITFLPIALFFLKSILNKRELSVAFGLGLIPLLIYGYDFFTNYRVFSFSQGIIEESGSLSIKIEILKSYLNDVLIKTPDYLLFLFGNLHFEVQFDSDVGYLLSFFGVIPLLAIIVFWVESYLKTIRDFRYIYIIFLISIGATILINFRFSIILFIILTIYHSENK